MQLLIARSTKAMRCEICIIHAYVYRRRRARMRPRSVPRTCVRAYNSGTGGWDTRANPWPMQGALSRTLVSSALPFDAWKDCKVAIYRLFLRPPLPRALCPLNCFILLYYSSAFFQLRRLISPFDRARHRLEHADTLNARMHFSPVLRRRKRNILSDGIYAFLWNMFKIFKTCLAEGITATKEYGTRAQSLRLSPLCASVEETRGLELTWDPECVSTEGEPACLVNMDFTNDPTNLYALFFIRRVIPP